MVRQILMSPVRININKDIILGKQFGYLPQKPE